MKKIRFSGVINDVVDRDYESWVCHIYADDILVGRLARASQSAPWRLFLDADDPMELTVSLAAAKAAVRHKLGG